MNHVPVPHLWPIRIYYEDTDAGGLVYHANYLKYFERARTELLRCCGVNQQKMAEQQHAMFVMRSAQVDYILPAKLDDELVVSTLIDKLGRASILFVQEVWREHECLSRARFKIGCVDTKMRRPCVIPQDVAETVK